MPIAKLMTNLTLSSYLFLKREAERTHKTMREIIEESVRIYKREKKKEMMRKDVARFAEDKEYIKEMVDLAEAGMEYYLPDIEKTDEYEYEHKKV